MHTSCCINEGDQVIIRSNKLLKVFQVRKSRQIRVEKVKFYLDGAIGEYYGSTFEVIDGKLCKVSFAAKEDQTTDTEMTKDNRNLTDTAENQKLKKEDIHALRKDGATGKEIIDHLVENSATFKAKTDFAQEKYIQKKKKKHVSLFTFLKPNTRLLAQMYFSKGPMKICNLRYDSIAQILTHGNIHAGCKLIMFESLSGLLIGAALERLAGHGKILQLYNGSAPSREALEAYQFLPEVKNVLLSFPLVEVSSLGRNRCYTQNENCDTAIADTPVEENLKQMDSSTMLCNINDVESKTDYTNDVIQEIGQNVKTKPSENNKGEGDMQSDTVEKHSDLGQSNRRNDEEAVKEQRKQHRLIENAKSKEFLESCTADGLIVASKYHPTPIVLSLIDFVAPSRPIVVFSQYKEPLVDCYIKLRDRGCVLNLRVTETWLRNFQVLPSRTHPEINMSGTGGYLLTGTTVLFEEKTLKANN